MGAEPERSPSFLCLLACGVLSALGAPSWAGEAKKPDGAQFYVRKNTWQETMLASRAALVRELEEAAGGLDGVELGPWYTTGPLKAKGFEDALSPETGAGPGAKDKAGKPLWQKRPDWKDGTVHRLPGGNSVSTYLFRVIRARKRVSLTAFLGSDDGLVVWLNGRKLFSKSIRRGAKPDQELVALNLAAGENRLLLKVFNRSGGHGFYFSTRPKKGWSTELDVWRLIESDFPVQIDWMMQDDDGPVYPPWFESPEDVGIEKALITKALKELGRAGGELQAEFERLCRSGAPPDNRRWLDLYVKACELRRGIRLRPLLGKWRKIVFTKHYSLGGSHYAYTEGLSEASGERHFKPGSSLCLLEMDGLYGKVQTLIDDPQGVIRDPDVSYDGKRILFAWKKSDRKDDYHLYDMDVRSRKIRQLTSGLGFADYEGAYLPNGDIVFNSTRCVQTVDCWTTDVSNLFTCDEDGKYLRRLSFDQVHTNFPTVMDDGRVIYTRWEYSDRGQIYPQPLFQMNPDGTGQTEFYGNVSYFPTSILHARGIPGSGKVVAVLAGHHSRQMGKLAVIDPARGRQEASGVQLIAPVRETKAERIDGYGQRGELFQYPYPLSATEFLVTYAPGRPGSSPPGAHELYGKDAHLPFSWDKWWGRFRIYSMAIDGRRELLAADPNISCNQPVPLAPRKRPHLRPSLVDYRKKTGTFYMQDIGVGEALRGVPRGTVKKLRVVGLKYRAAVVGNHNNRGPAGGAMVTTPVAVSNGSWDVKVVLGDAEVYEDGSALFTVPARMPVYFQALDGKGRAVQTMRSWSTLQPGEFFSCVGCHEAKDTAPRVGARMTLAMKAGPQGLSPFYGPPRGFSFVKEIQPILDKHCIRCHNDRSLVKMKQPFRPDLLKPEEAAERKPPAAGKKTAFSLLGDQKRYDGSQLQFSDSYISLTQRGVVKWISAQSVPSMLPPYYAGAVTSRLVHMLEAGHNEVRPSREEMDKIACWIDLLVPYCGDYGETWQRKSAKYDRALAKRKRMEEVERKNIEELIALKTGARGKPEPKAGKDPRRPTATASPEGSQ